MTEEGASIDVTGRDSVAERHGRAPQSGQSEAHEAIAARMSRIKHKLLVMSGKGGVGKSTVAVNLACAFAQRGFRTGVLDIDIHGPNIPKMLGIEGQRVVGVDGALQPVTGMANLKLMSAGFLLSRESDAVIWRGPLKMRLIEQFLRDVDWGDLDFLVIDAPPGTGDEPLSICQLIEDADGAVIVTTPQEVALTDIRKSVTFCRQVRIKILGIVENMSGFVCPHCGKRTDLFKAGGGARLAKEMQVPFLGEIPLDGSVVEAGDDGIPIVARAPKSEVAAAIKHLAERLEFDAEPP